MKTIKIISILIVTLFLSACEKESDIFDILESVDTYELLKKLLRIYHKEVALIDILLSPPQLEQDNDTPFSLS